VPLETFCALNHAIRSIDGSMSGNVDEALESQGHKRRVSLALPHFHAVALAVARGEYIAAVPKQFADAVKTDLRLRTYQPPLEVPVPQIKLYWHARHDGEAAHQWMRHQVLAAVHELGLEEQKLTA
jgi:DNA-binding transcriptional LysR family regulator